MTQQNSDISDVTSANKAANAETQAIDWIEILSVLWRSRKLIAYVTVTATVPSIIISLMFQSTQKGGEA